MSTSVYIRNRCPSKALDGVTPKEKWCKIKPTVSHFRTFGCKAYCLDKRLGKSKFQPRGIECTFIGYCSESKAYWMIDLKTKRVFKTRDVKFVGEETQALNNYNYNVFENAYGERSDSKENANGSNAQKSEEQDVICFDLANGSENNGILEITSSNESSHGENSVNNTIRGQSNEQSNSSNLVNNINENVNYKVLRSGKVIYNNLLSTQNITENQKEEDVPVNIEDVMKREDKEKWIDSMKSEYNSLLSRGTWILVDRPQDLPVIKNKWVFTIKRAKNGEIERYKCRLVAKGCSQKYGVNYIETFSPVTRYSTIRTVLALATEFKLHIHQLDVTAAYLYGDVDSDIYMEQPVGFEDSKNLN